MITAIEFGSQQSILNVREWDLYSDVFTSASFLIPALFFLLLYRLRREERSLLYLGGFCVASMVYVQSC
ncbi:hypothetical protein [Paenibacillus sp. y28]|uniref:hypothetical protein n=1 Tax=Paenibacillus sp. y28 TaxID=3129110 RepID=UPI00301730DC